jgi:hypothetical protein
LNARSPDDGAALVDIDQRHVEPGALLQELQITAAFGLDVGKAYQNQPVTFTARADSGVPRLL